MATTAESTLGLGSELGCRDPGHDSRGAVDLDSKTEKPCPTRPGDHVLRHLFLHHHDHFGGLTVGFQEMPDNGRSNEVGQVPDYLVIAMLARKTLHGVVRLNNSCGEHLSRMSAVTTWT